MSINVGQLRELLAGLEDFDEVVFSLDIATGAEMFDESDIFEFRETIIRAKGPRVLIRLRKRG